MARSEPTGALGGLYEKRDAPLLFEPLEERVLLSVPGTITWTETLPSGEPAQFEGHYATVEDVQAMKGRLGVLQDGETYDYVVIDGHGTGWRPATESEYAAMVGDAMIITNITSIGNGGAGGGAAGAPALAGAVDLTQTIWFPPIGSQGLENSCSFWASVYYMKTFQEARQHNWDLSGATWEGTNEFGAPDAAHQQYIFDPDFVYHQYNGAINQGTISTDPFGDPVALMATIGTAPWSVSPYTSGDYTSWPSEAAYREAPLYRVGDAGVQTVDFSASIDPIKTSLDNSQPLAIGVNANLMYEMTTLDNYTSWTPNHANTIVGYDDSVWYIESGVQTFGAFKIANSWGPTWTGETTNDGCWWMSYECMRQRVSTGYYYLDIDPGAGPGTYYDPDTLAVFEIYHEDRYDTTVQIEVDNGATPKPFDSPTMPSSPLMPKGSAPYPNNKIILDITEMLGTTANTYTIRITNSGSTGQLTYFGIEKYADYQPGTRAIRAQAVSADTPLTLTGTKTADATFGSQTLAPGPPVLAAASDTGVSDSDDITSYQVLAASYTTHSNTTTVGIPATGTAQSTISFAETFNIADVNVGFDITYAQDSDLTLTLTGPDATSVQLFTNVGGTGSNFTGTSLDDHQAVRIDAGSAPFTGAYIPLNALSAFDGKSVTGTWTLEVANSGALTGTLNSWYLEIADDTQPIPVMDFEVTGTIAGATVEIIADGSTGAPIGAAIATGTTTTVHTALWNMTAGVHTVTAQQTDTGGGLSTSILSNPLTVTIDNTAPTTPNAPDLYESSYQTVDSQGDKLTDTQTNLSFYTGNEPNDYFRFERDGTQHSADYVAGTSYNLGTEAAVGRYHYTIKSVDAAGNVSTESEREYVEVVNFAEAGDYAYTNGVSVYVVDIDPSNGLSVPNIAWSPGEYRPGVTDILFSMGSSRVNGIASITLFGDGTRTRDLGFLIQGNSFLGPVTDLRTTPTDIGFIYSTGDIQGVTLNAGIIGYDIDAYAALIGVTLTPTPTWTLDDAALYSGGTLQRATITGGNVTGDVFAETNMGTVSVRQNRLGVGGTIDNEWIRTNGNLYEVYANVISDTSDIRAGGNITSVRADTIGTLGGTHVIYAAGTINRVVATNGSVNSTIDAWGTGTYTIHMVSATNGDVTGTIDALNGGICMVNATSLTGVGGNISANITASTDVLQVFANGGNITGTILTVLGRLGTVLTTAGDLTGNLNIWSSISTVSIRGDITGTIVSHAGRINYVCAFGNITNATANAIQAQTSVGVVMAIGGNIVSDITAVTGGVSLVMARVSGGAGGAISSDIAAQLTIGSVIAIGGGITGTIQSTAGAINCVLAQGGDVNNATANAIQANGMVVMVYALNGSVNSDVRSTGSRVNVVMAINGNVGGDVTSNTSGVTYVLARGGSVTGAIQGATVGTVYAINGNVSGTVTATTGAVSAIIASGGGITGNVTAATRVGTVMAINGNIAANVTAGTSVTIVMAVRGGYTGTIAAGTTIGSVIVIGGDINAVGTPGVTPGIGTAAGSISIVQAVTVGGVGGNITAFIAAFGGNVNAVMAIGGDFTGGVGATGRVNYVLAQAVGGTGGSFLVHGASGLGGVAAQSIGTVMAIGGKIGGTVANRMTIVAAGGTGVGTLLTTTGDIEYLDVDSDARVNYFASGRDVTSVNVRVVSSNIGTVRATRNVTDCLFSAGYNFVTTTAFNGSIAGVYIGGNAHNMNVVAGVDPVDGTFGNGNDVGAGGTGTIGYVTVRGTITDDGTAHAFEAESGRFTARDNANSSTADGTEVYPHLFPATQTNVQIV